MNKKFLSGFLSVLKNACIIFTVTVFAFYFMGSLMSNAQQTLTLSKMVLVFVFSLWFALCNLFLNFKNLNIIIRIALHFVSSTFGFYVIFLLIPGYAENQAGAFALTIGFILLYVIVATLIGIVRKLTTKESQKDNEYKSIYNKNKNNDDQD